MSFRKTVSFNCLEERLLAILRFQIDFLSEQTVLVVGSKPKSHYFV